MRHWEELIDFIKKNCALKVSNCLTAIWSCSLTQEELNEQYMGLYAAVPMMNNTLYSQISYNSSLSKAIKLKLGRNLKLFLVEMNTTTGKDIAEHVLRPAKVIPASLAPVSYAPLLISICRLQMDLMKINEWLMRRQVGLRLKVLM